MEELHYKGKHQTMAAHVKIKCLCNSAEQKRHWVMSVLEVVIPTVLFIALVILRAEGHNRILGKTKMFIRCFV